MAHFLLIMSMCLLYMIQEVVPKESFVSLVTINCIIVFVVSFYQLNKRRKIFIGSLFGMGVLIHVSYGNTWMGVFDGITQNLALLSIILLAPLISIPLKREGIIDTVVKKLDEVKGSKRKTFYGVSSFMMILAPILNMGAIRIVHGFVDGLKVPPRLLSKSYYSGFTPAIIWSPFFASVGVVLYMMEVPYMTYFPVGIGFATLQVLVSFFILKPTDKETGEEIKGDTNKKDRKNFYLLFGFVFVLIFLLVLMETITKLPMLFLVSANCLFVPFIYALVRNKWSQMKKEISNYKFQVEKHSNMEITLFLSAGLFGNALLHTPITDALKNVVIWSSKGSVLLLFLFIIVFCTFMAAIGIHQIIVIPLILTILSSEDVNVGVLAAGFMCIFTWMFSASVSPLNALNIIISNCVKNNGLKVAFNWNGKYFIGITSLAFVYVFFLNFLD